MKKKSSDGFEQWREETLTECGHKIVNKVHHLFCAAHILLRLHSYAMNVIKLLH